MKRFLLNLGEAVTKVGERHGIRWMVYNPIIWARFLTSSRHGGRIFSQAVAETFPEVRSCLDVGSGAGGYIYWLKRTGFRASGVEYSGVGKILARLQGAVVHPFDCSDVAKRPSLGPVDLAFSIEVAEHIPQELEESFVSYIASQSRLVIFSAAHPGQGGQGHVNEQPKLHWRAMFEKLGFALSGDETERLSESLNALGFRGWLPTNCQVFRRRSQGTGHS
jgi:hypothetical protein